MVRYYRVIDYKGLHSRQKTSIGCNLLVVGFFRAKSCKSKFTN